MRFVRRFLPVTVLMASVVVGAAAPTARGQVFKPDVYLTGENMAEYMREVPGGGQPGGPDYTFRMGRYEITNAQFAAFLNDAQLDGGATGRGSNMVFQDDGRVRISPGGPTIFRAFPASFSQIDYDLSAPIGERFSPIVKAGMDMSPHPVNLVSWFGSVKFANWLTIDRGLDEAQRVYTEGPNADDWHPVTISTADWQVRDLNATERQALVDNFDGFRLPMDDGASAASTFNEFYKAAAWDPNALTNHVYGFGRNFIDQFDANGSRLHPESDFFNDDPFEVGDIPFTTPVGFYDGTLWQRSDWNWPSQDPPFPTFQTRINENAFDIFDLSGNVWEWQQDQVFLPSADRALRSGSWGSGDIGLESAFRFQGFSGGPDRFNGFRIVQVPEPSIVALILIGGGAVVVRRRPV